MEYVEKPKTIHAIQYDGTPESATEIENWLKELLGNEFEFTMLGLPEGFYVAFIAGLEIFDPTEFETRYEQVGS